MQVAQLEDRALNAHLAQIDALETNHEAACRNVNDKHIAEAVSMVKDDLQNQVAAGNVSVYDASILMALFERIEEVAVECSWADLCREVCHG